MITNFLLKTQKQFLFIGMKRQYIGGRVEIETCQNRKGQKWITYYERGPHFTGFGGDAPYQ